MTAMNHPLEAFLPPDACATARERLRALPLDTTPSQAWALCAKPNDMLWLIGQRLPKRVSVLLACDFARSVFHLTGPAAPQARAAIEAALDWCREPSPAARERALAASYAARTASYDANVRAASYAACTAAAAAAACTAIAAAASSACIADVAADTDNAATRTAASSAYAYAPCDDAHICDLIRARVRCDDAGRLHEVNP